MLLQRIVTALSLLAILLPALFYPSPYAFFGVALILVTAGGWEWGRLNGLAGIPAYLLAAAIFSVCSVAWFAGLPWQPSMPMWLAVSTVWVALGVWLLRGGPKSWAKVPLVFRLAGGVVLLVFAWVAIAQAKVIGVNFLLSALLLVWVADIGAYFAGRALGGRFSRGRLAPSISPGKSWEGVWGGMLGVMVLALIWVKLDVHLGASVPSLYSRVHSAGWVVLIVATLCMTALSVVGDLVESLIKRSAGAKDSSNLLPGHGGVLDRLDALLPTMPLAMLLYSIQWK